MYAVCYSYIVGGMTADTYGPISHVGHDLLYMSYWKEPIENLQVTVCVICRNIMLDPSPYIVGSALASYWQEPS